ncbi:transcriptional regulator [Halobacillus halophilus]|uniref:HTH domain protein n=1 Tax=Halobacillus halophilus (strain ATCC 35676 / DSM 2266 / JCM 20832 / KCTC 3685 / LMG 17431 / NBRC 102448 / NCIMB 2269) TaxID=866895 RepID=I0JIM4_HALH3|nr:helix-turn-helix domain-containing protein [Halobacillus halophilus]ASF38175.1 transcriptional regulator [Halobacillus halophilus]CCG43992.1 HTH domain protein [Halobacillus halophilus DSM 2266]
MERKVLIKCRGKQSRPELAKKLGITPQMLGALERGDRTPSLALAKTIADYFGVTVDEIFFNQKRNDTCLKITESTKEVI